MNPGGKFAVSSLLSAFETIINYSCLSSKDPNNHPDELQSVSIQRSTSLTPTVENGSADDKIGMTDVGGCILYDKQYHSSHSF